ncbi:metal-dependent transcriptional regulator [Candidatus Bathyarchaeota archaeon]|nr:MAG: metal-dependent transcriptional regulator [Candidatus Hecatellales archaeon]RLI35685.1 MAG: metal-dependent transcriptional regulator [Candidatus Bathyarchaeota archaeon]
MKGKTYSASFEDYLEAIYLLGREKGEVRVTDLAAKLKVKKASVSEALIKLADRGLIKHERYGTVTLTSKGREIAEKVFRTHQAVYRFLREILGVDAETAEKDACAIEHAVSRETLSKLEEFLEKFPLEKSRKN